MPQARDEAGNIWEVDAHGNPVALVQAASAAPQGQVFTLPPDPVEQQRLAMEQARLGLTQENAARTAVNDAARLDLERQRVATATQTAAKPPAGFRWTDEGKLEAIPGGPEDPKAANNRSSKLRTLLQQIDRVEELYRQNLAGGFPNAVAGRVPGVIRPENEQFDAAAAGLAEQGLSAFRVPGVGSQSDAELRQFVQANRPLPTDSDLAIEEKLRTLRLRAEEEIRGSEQDEQEDDDQPNALTATRFMGGGGLGAAGVGATTGIDPYPPGYTDAHAAFIKGVGKKSDPQAYVAFRTALDQQYGYESDPEAYATWAADLQNYNGTIPTDPLPPERPLSGLEQVRNDVVSSPVGAAVTGAADMGSFGLASLLAGQDRMDALTENQPVATTLGQIGGSITGASALGRASAALAGRVAPNVLGGGARAQFGRNLATDVGYGGIYGGVTEGDPLTSAALAGIGSAGGQAVGKAVGATIGGGRLSRAAEALQSRGVPLTVGRRLGDITSRIEDRMASVPIVGDMVRRRQTEAFEGFNRAAFDEAGAPIGYQPTAIGEPGVQQFQSAVGSAYDTATRGVTSPLDGQFIADMQGAIARGQRLPDDLQTSLRSVLEARVAPATDTGNITGYDYQQAMRALKATRANPPQRFQGFEQDYRDAISQAMDALTGQIQRGGGQNTIDGLAAANAANRNLKILENASLDRARVGTRTGEVGVFAPSQLVDAARAAEKKYPGANPLKALGEEGQAVLPSTVPNSGTADRLMQYGLGAGALGAGVGADATLGTEVSPYMMGLAALLTAGGTRAGQNMLGAVINTRPAAARRFGEAVNRRRGLFGHAGVPLLIAN